MRWEAWTLLGLFVIGLLGSIGTAGEPRKPTTNAQVVVIVIMDAFLIWLAVRLGVS